MSTVNKILYVDDHQLLRKSMELLLKSHYRNLELTLSSNGFEALDLLLHESFDVVLLDINMPKMDGLTVLRKLRNNSISSKTIVLSLESDSTSIRTSFELGALCYLNKDSSSEELFRAIDTVSKGEKYYTDLATKIILNEKEKNEKKNSVLNQLSKRELEVFNLIILDHSNDNIANLLNISVRTVEGHRRNIRDKLGLKTIASMVRFAIDNNFQSK